MINSNSTGRNLQVLKEATVRSSSTIGCIQLQVIEKWQIHNFEMKINEWMRLIEDRKKCKCI